MNLQFVENVKLINQETWQSQLRSNSFDLLNGKFYLCINYTLKSQLLCSDYSHYNSYQEFLYNLCTSLKKKGLGYRKISYYLNENGYKSVRGKEIKNTSVYSILKKGKMRIDRINQLKSHKDYGYTYDIKLIE